MTIVLALSPNPENQYGELLSEFLTKKDPKCTICQVDTPCEHQLDQIRLEGYNAGIEFHEAKHDRVEMYGALLEDGDFEKFQPNIYIKPRSLSNPDYVLALLEATCQEYRTYWIRNRLTEYLSPQWNQWNEKTMDAFERAAVLAHLADKMGLQHKSIPYFRSV